MSASRACRAVNDDAHSSGTHEKQYLDVDIIQFHLRFAKVLHLRSDVATDTACTSDNTDTVREDGGRAAGRSCASRGSAKDRRDVETGRGPERALLSCSAGTIVCSPNHVEQMPKRFCNAIDSGAVTSLGATEEALHPAAPRCSGGRSADNAL